MKKRDFTEYIGKKFNLLTIVGVTFRPRPNWSDTVYFAYKCDCGNEGQTEAYRVLNGRTKACGCIRGTKPLNDPIKSLHKFAYNILNSQANDRDIPVTISLDEFVAISSLPCHYDLSPPHRDIAIQWQKKIKDASRKFNGKKQGGDKRAEGMSWFINGIDRIDSNLGYEPGNVVPCCKKCNAAKADMTYADFKAFILNLAAHLSKSA